MFYVYVLESKNHELYTGSTSDFKRRLVEHNRGRVPSTASGKPWRCIYCEMCLIESDARRRERYLKTSQGRRMLKLRIKDYLYQSRARRNFTAGYEI